MRLSPDCNINELFYSRLAVVLIKKCILASLFTFSRAHEQAHFNQYLLNYFLFYLSVSVKNYEQILSLHLLYKAILVDKLAFSK